MTSAEDGLCGLRQGGRRLERYVEEFLELSNRVSWHVAALVRVSCWGWMMKLYAAIFQIVIFHWSSLLT